MNTRSRFGALRLATTFSVATLLPVIAAAQTILAPGVFDGWPPANVEPGPAAAKRPTFLSDINSALTSDLALFRRGEFAVRPHFVYRFVDTTGIEVGGPEPLDTTMQSIAPGVMIQAGLHWEGDYTPAWTFYSNRQFKDSFDQTARLSGSYDFTDWSIGVSGAYSSTYPILVEFARQSHQVNLSGQIRSVYRFTKRTSIELSVAQDTLHAAPLKTTTDWVSPNTRNWSTTDVLRWEVTPRLKVSAGMSYGYSNPSVGPSMTYVRPLVQVGWTPTDKISVDAEGGYEDREFRHTDAERLRSPTYTAAVRYRPFEVTTVSALISHGVAVAYLANTMTKIDAWKLELRQRLLQKLYLGVGYMQQNTDYLEVHSNLPVTRGDRFDTVDVRLGMPFAARGSISVFYMRTHNRSSHAEFEFRSRQLGLEVSFKF